MTRTLFVGDVHSCADELQLLLEQVQPSRVILVGDVFNKGPDPEGTWRLVQKWDCEAVMGNHDLVVLRKADAGELRAPADAIEWVRSLPMSIEGDGWIAVHAGLNPEGETTLKHAVSLRRWPDDSNPENPFWWQLYRGSSLVVYGHDAVRGVRDHRPRTLGLDSGCVYGGSLTGYVLEEDRLVSVPARRVYQPV